MIVFSRWTNKNLLFSLQIRSFLRRIELMKLSYEKLWKLLKANKMNKSDFMRATKISEYTLSKLNHNESVSLDTLMRVCKVFHCQASDVVEMIDDDL